MSHNSKVSDTLCVRCLTPCVLTNNTQGDPGGVKHPFSHDNFWVSDTLIRHLDYSPLFFKKKGGCRLTPPYNGLLLVLVFT